MDKGYSAILCPPPPPTGGGETSKGPDTTDIKLPSGDLNQEAAIPTKDIVLQGSGRLLSCGSSLLPEAFYETSYKLGALIVFLPLILFGLRRKR